MNKKYITLIITAVVLIGLVVAGIVAFNYFMSFKTVTINIKQPGIAVDIYKNDFAAEEGNDTANPKVGSMSSSGTLKLQAGSYSIHPTTKNTDPSAIGFIVDKSDLTVEVNPGYSNDYLSSLALQERPAIDALLKATYAHQLADYTINSGKLYDKGEWYGTTMTQNVQPEDVGDVYRTILHKVNGTWKIVAAPQLVLNASDNKTIPVDILRDVNKLQEGAN